MSRPRSWARYAADMDHAARTKAIEKRTKEIVARAEKENPGKRAEVAEMFIGRTYVLFIYTYLKDIRLVYIPPRSIGNFGGEDDNWMWPRHTGDFSFLRAYVAPDGSPADYSPRNVPFKPKRFLEIEPRGVDEGDFVFLLGYPGRTYRHYPASYLAYDEEVRMPYIADWYAWQIDLMEKMGASDRGVALRHAARIKGLANTMKNYRGKLKGMNTPRPRRAAAGAGSRPPAIHRRRPGAARPLRRRPAGPRQDLRRDAGGLRIRHAPRLSPRFGEPDELRRHRHRGRGSSGRSRTWSASRGSWSETFRRRNSACCFPCAIITSRRTRRS